MKKNQIIILIIVILIALAGIFVLFRGGKEVSQEEDRAVTPVIEEPVPRPPVKQVSCSDDVLVFSIKRGKDYEFAVSTDPEGRGNEQAVTLGDFPPGVEGTLDTETETGKAIINIEVSISANAGSYSGVIIYDDPGTEDEPYYCQYNLIIE